MPPRRGEVAKEEENGSVERLHGVKVVRLVSHPSSGSSELTCALGINSVIRIILACYHKGPRGKPVGWVASFGSNAPRVVYSANYL